VSYRLVVIEDHAVPADASVCTALAHDSLYRCQQTTLDQLPHRFAGNLGADAIVAVAVPETRTTSDVFAWLRDHPTPIPRFAVLPSEPGESLLRIASQVADDFIVSPVRSDELRHRLGRVLGISPDSVEAVSQRLRIEMGLAQVVGTDPTFVRAIEHLPRFARSDMPVLITGETGTGKELCARAIHHLGPRRNQPFIEVDCGAMPEHLFENELFGHARGAFTDAHREQRGLVAMADGGTLFLDEIDSLSMSAQAKLLRFLQEHTFRALGADRFQRVDANVIAATNRDLEACVRSGEFRSDLYFRLHVLRLHLPPLRDRQSDIALLAQHFLAARRGKTTSTPRTLSAAALRLLTLYHWPGNVRELANVMERAIVACDGPQILPSHIVFSHMQSARALAPAEFREARAAVVAAFERGYIEDLLRKHRGNVTRAAREAHKERRAFGRLMKKYSIGRYDVDVRN